MVTSVNNKTDQDYLDIANQNMSRQELTEFLEARLVIITDEDEKTGQQLIKTVSLSAEPDGFRRSMSLAKSLKASGARRADSLISNVSKKDVIKNRSIRVSSKNRDNTDNVSLRSSIVHSSLNS